MRRLSVGLAIIFVFGVGLGSGLALRPTGPSSLIAPAATAIPAAAPVPPGLDLPPPEYVIGALNTTLKTPPALKRFSPQYLDYLRNSSDRLVGRWYMDALTRSYAGSSPVPPDEFFMQALVDDPFTAEKKKILDTVPLVDTVGMIVERFDRSSPAYRYAAALEHAPAIWLVFLLSKKPLMGARCDLDFNQEWATYLYERSGNPELTWMDHLLAGTSAWCIERKRAG